MALAAAAAFAVDGPAPVAPTEDPAQAFESITEEPIISPVIAADEIPDTLLEAPTVNAAVRAQPAATMAPSGDAAASPPLANVLASLNDVDASAPFATISDILAVINQEFLSQAPTAENPSDLVLQIIRPKPADETPST